MPHAGGVDSDSASARFTIGMTAILLGTRVSPAINNRNLTEGYLTQPMLMGRAGFPRYHLGLQGTLNLEGLTLRRGELDPGIYGEGYVDRRHPHTYMHELVATWTRRVASHALISATAGKGFAAFGTDDPMSRPLVNYPVHHHLAQILERAIVIGAATAGPLVLEVSRFNGDEPDSPSDLPNASRLFDSWSARATVRFWPGSEVQTSFARVLSPEVSSGGGLTQKKWSTSGRYESARLYGLAEFAKTDESESGRNAFSFSSMLAEGRVFIEKAALAIRAERTERPEEERLADQFRTPRPASDLSLLGRTRWTTVTVNASRSLELPRSLRFAPFVQVSRAHAAAVDRAAVFEPRSFYGSDVMWSVSAGVRLGLGMVHGRMGRYGAALQQGQMTMDGMEMDH